VSINRVQVVWSGGPTVGGGLSTFYFDSATGTAAQQVAAVATFLGSTDDRRVIAQTWATAADVATLNVGTGALESTTSTTPSTGTGTQTGDALPPAVQGLLRLLTSTVAGGRLLRGRLFLPGAGAGSSDSNGGVLAAYSGDYNAAGAALIADTNTNWMVWSPTHSTAASVTSVSCWSKWATLRSRRD